MRKSPFSRSTHAFHRARRGDTRVSMASASSPWKLLVCLREGRVESRRATRGNETADWVPRRRWRFFFFFSPPRNEGRGKRTQRRTASSIVVSANLGEVNVHDVVSFGPGTDSIGRKQRGDGYIASRDISLFSHWPRGCSANLVRRRAAPRRATPRHAAPSRRKRANVATTSPRARGEDRVAVENREFGSACLGSPRPDFSSRQKPSFASTFVATGLCFYQLLLADTHSALACTDDYHKYILFARKVCAYVIAIHRYSLDLSRRCFSSCVLEPAP